MDEGIVSFSHCDSGLHLIKNLSSIIISQNGLLISKNFYKEKKLTIETNCAPSLLSIHLQDTLNLQVEQLF